MFRELTRKKQKLSTTECKEILKQEVRGVLAVNGDDGYPYALPINFYFDEENNKIYFHRSKWVVNLIWAIVRKVINYLSSVNIKSRIKYI